MAIIFCSHKLTKLFGIPKGNPIITDYIDDFYRWNAHLFYLNKRKCLLFMNKPTLYSFVILDILKKDLINYSELFLDHFIGQIKADFLFTKDFQHIIDYGYQNIILVSSDNDRKVIGSMNDCIFRIGIDESIEGGIEYLNPNYIENRLNETPMGALKYKLPVEMMRECIKNHT